MMSFRFNLRLVFIALLAMLTVQAQAGDWWRKIKNWVDSADVKGCDTAYVRLSDKGFVAYGNTVLTGTHISLRYDYQPGNANGKVLTGQLNTRVATLASVGVSYRGWGLSYSRDFSGYNDTEWAFTTYGQSYGAEFRIHNSHSLAGSLDTLQDVTTQVGYTVDVNACHQKTIIANVYYVSNRGRFSLPAAMSHTVIQRRSCGAWLALLNLHYASTDIDKGIGMRLSMEFNYDGQYGTGNLYRLVQSQVSLGGGYAYNWVFGSEHNLLHASLMPMVSLYHRNVGHYNVRYSDRNSQLIRTSREEKELEQLFSFNAAAHLSYVHNSGPIVTGFQGILNLDNLSTRNNRLRLTTYDWYLRFFVGYRF